MLIFDWFCFQTHLSKCEHIILNACKNVKISLSVVLEFTCYSVFAVVFFMETIYSNNKHNYDIHWNLAWVEIIKETISKTNGEF